jgi:hypothetical protein
MGFEKGLGVGEQRMKEPHDVLVRKKRIDPWMGEGVALLRPCCGSAWFTGSMVCR